MDCFVAGLDIPVCSVESMQQSRGYQKEQQRQFKELKELERRHQKETAELLRVFNNKCKKMARQCSKSRFTCLLTHKDQSAIQNWVRYLFNIL